MSTAQPTRPRLWEVVKDELIWSDEGGEPGEWSARKAQLAAAEYERRGGSYRAADLGDAHLARWSAPATPAATREVRRGGAGHRYSQQSAEFAEKTAQFGKRIIEARKSDLIALARDLGVRGPTRMTKTELARAIHKTLKNAGDLSKETLARYARALRVAGRSRMSKRELWAALIGTA
ncbi:Rho termination factor N-terminal domain-containing protein [Acuticoccus mangrovi]|uniref:Rho termination factor N-terminal domain-containing protein n=1 Tax=Acuticoccus mangrovi TaxID=2796142 RepID=A0A934IT85_9HYPH|nr:Rho termination factor N-terminal domain-containing protein [Acuticoccus mangrovi]MBJ3777600.1 Rho termination factor N-terminal domain-containing protein [Acuticoccus mangrovi]